MLPKSDYEEICVNLKKRMAKNYVNYYLEIEDKYEREHFFTVFFLFYWYNNSSNLLWLSTIILITKFNLLDK